MNCVSLMTLDASVMRSDSLEPRLLPRLGPTGIDLGRTPSIRPCATSALTAAAVTAGDAGSCAVAAAIDSGPMELDSDFWCVMKLPLECGGVAAPAERLCDTVAGGGDASSVVAPPPLLLARDAAVAAPVAPTTGALEANGGEVDRGELDDESEVDSGGDGDEALAPRAVCGGDEADDDSEPLPTGTAIAPAASAPAPLLAAAPPLEATSPGAAAVVAPAAAVLASLAAPAALAASPGAGAAPAAPAAGVPWAPAAAAAGSAAVFGEAEASALEVRACCIGSCGQKVRGRRSRGGIGVLWS